MYAACLTVLPVAPAVTAAAAAARPENQNLIRQKNKEKRIPLRESSFHIKSAPYEGADFINSYLSAKVW